MKGIEYIAGCRITDALNRHEKESHHDRAKSIYERYASNLSESEYTNETRDIIKIIIKIIIFLTTHGEHNKNIQ